MKFSKWNTNAEKWNTARLTQGPRYFKSNANGFQFSFRTKEGTFNILLSPQECDDWLGEFTIAAKQVEA